MESSSDTGRFAFSTKAFMRKSDGSGQSIFLFRLSSFSALVLMGWKELEFRYEIISLCSALFVWLMIFGLIGVFRKFFSGESLKIRFVSDSAYWLYIAHLPLIQVLQIWVSDWPVPSLTKDRRYLRRNDSVASCCLPLSNPLHPGRNDA